MCWSSIITQLTFDDKFTAGRLLEFSFIEEVLPLLHRRRNKKLRDGIEDVLNYKQLLNIEVFEALID
jgi:hypothetical protein